MRYFFNDICILIVDIILEKGPIMDDPKNEKKDDICQKKSENNKLFLFDYNRKQIKEEILPLL